MRGPEVSLGTTVSPDFVMSLKIIVVAELKNVYFGGQEMISIVIHRKKWE